MKKFYYETKMVLAIGTNNHDAMFTADSAHYFAMRFG